MKLCLVNPMSTSLQTPEIPILVPIPGYPGYSASADGRVWSLKRGAPRDLSQRHRDTWGYNLVDLYIEGRSISRLVHRLVGAAFLGPLPEGLQTRHLNGIKADNSVANLRYGTAKENAADNVRLGITANRRKSIARRYAKRYRGKLPPFTIMKVWTQPQSVVF